MRSAWLGLVAMAMACGVGLAQQPAQPGGQRVGQPIQPGQQLQQNAQGRDQPGQQLQQGQAGQAGHAGNADQQIAALIADLNRNEVEATKAAQSRLQSQETKQFAEMVIKDHTPDIQKYQQLAGNLASGQHAQGHAAGGLDWVSIHHQIGQQCLESKKQELARHEGAEADKCFMGQQLAAHMEAKDKLEVLRKNASQQLGQQIDQSLQVVNHHLQEARQIMEQLKDRPSERVSRKPEGNK